MSVAVLLEELRRLREDRSKTFAQLRKASLVQSTEIEKVKEFMRKEAEREKKMYEESMTRTHQAERKELEAKLTKKFEQEKKNYEGQLNAEFEKRLKQAREQVSSICKLCIFGLIECGYMFID